MFTMEPLTFVWYDYIIFFLMVGFSITIGIYYGIFDKNNAGVSNYFHGGKQLKVLPAAISLIASSFSVADLLAIPTEIYLHGSQYWAIIFSIPVVGLIVNYLYLPVICKLQVNSVFEYFELRFDIIIRRATTILFTTGCILFVSIVLYTPSLAFSQVTGFDVHYLTWIITVICIFYTSMGGLKAVVWSDTLQFLITISTLFLALIMGMADAGGLENVWKLAKNGDRIELFSMNPDPTIRATFWSVFFGGIVLWIAASCVTPVSTQRLLSVKSFSDSQSVLLIFCVGTIITKSIICFLGITMYAKYYNCDPLSTGAVERADQMIPYYVLDTVKEIPGMSVLFISGLFSTCFSVLSTFLNILAYLVYSEVVEPQFPTISENNANYVAKALTVLMGLICLALVYLIARLGSIFEITYSFCGIIGGTVVGILILGLIFPAANTKGAYCGGISAVAFMSFLIIKTNIYIWNGEIKYEPKPLYTSGCQINFTLSNTTFTYSSSPISNVQSEIPWIFRISFHYYMVFNALIVVIIGLLSSIITRRINDPPVNEDLISPITYRLFNRTKSYKYQDPKNALNVSAEEPTC